MICACDIRFCSADAWFSIKVRSQASWRSHVNTHTQHSVTRAHSATLVCILIVSMSQEVDIGLAADVGTLQRLPKIVGNDRFAMFLCSLLTSECPSINCLLSTIVFLVLQPRA